MESTMRYTSAKVRQRDRIMFLGFLYARADWVLTVTCIVLGVILFARCINNN